MKAVIIAIIIAAAVAVFVVQTKMYGGITDNITAGHEEEDDSDSSLENTVKWNEESPD